MYVQSKTFQHTFAARMLLTNIYSAYTLAHSRPSSLTERRFLSSQ